jgi:hypothetical protein
MHYPDESDPGAVADRAFLVRIGKLAAFSLLPAAVLFAGVEVWATFTIQRAVHTAVDPATGQSVYRMRIGRFPWSRESVTPLNSSGFPDVEFASLPPKDGCHHVAFTGDSFVFGDGVDSDSSFVGLIRHWSQVRSPAGQCVRVFNLGERGTTIDRQSERVRETLAEIQPDIVILGQYQNDLTDLAITQPAVDSTTPREVPTWTDVRQRFGSFNLNSVRLLSYQAFGFAIRRDIHYDVLNHWSVLADTSRKEAAVQLMEDYRELYASLATDLAERDVEFGAIIIPSKFDLLADRYPEEDFFIELAREYDVPYLRLYPVLDANRSDYPFLMYDGHLNEFGNRLIAEAIYEWLYRSDPAPFPGFRRCLINNHEPFCRSLRTDQRPGPLLIRRPLIR